MIVSKLRAFAESVKTLYRWSGRPRGAPGRRAVIHGVYNKRILELAADIPRLGRLAQPQGSSTAYSRLCGSTITVDLSLEQGKVCDLRRSSKACALGQASASILARHVLGATPEELRTVRDTMRKMLKENGPPPGGRWADPAALEPSAITRRATPRRFCRLQTRPTPPSMRSKAPNPVSGSPFPVRASLP